MVQGTASNVGKSVLVAGLARVFARRGLRVAPFKSQNMALNSAVTPEGAEIGRAQAFQARAAGIEPHADMNPVLLKPCSPTGSQVIVMGRPVGVMQVREYHSYQRTAWPVVTQALMRLRRRFDLVVAEGAGSPAEINLRDHDIANMEVALHARAPVLLVADIERGGTFASLVGTMELLTPAERAHVAGFIINRFRGDASLLGPGIRMLEERYRIPVLGVLPHLAGLVVDEEDSLGIESIRPRPAAELVIAAIRLPYISNFTDLTALASEPDVSVRWVSGPAELDGIDAIIIPGSKSTLADLAWLRRTRIAEALITAAENGVPVVGVCGGYQMLGRTIADPLGIEAGAAEDDGNLSAGVNAGVSAGVGTGISEDPAGKTGGDSSTRVADGLGLLDVETVFVADKRTKRAHGTLTGAAFGPAGTPVVGYEIHMGRTTLGDGADPLLVLGDDDSAAATATATDGAASRHLPVFGTYLHGLFDSAGARRFWLDTLRVRKGLEPLSLAVEPASDGSAIASAVARRPDPDSIDRLADVIESELDLSAIFRLVGLGDMP